MFSSQKHAITKWFKFAGFYKKILCGNLLYTHISMANIVCKKGFLFPVEIKKNC